MDSLPVILPSRPPASSALTPAHYSFDFFQYGSTAMVEAWRNGCQALNAGNDAFSESLAVATAMAPAFAGIFRWYSAMAETVRSCTPQYTKSAWDIFPHNEVVIEKPFCTLRRFSCAAYKDPQRSRVLLVAPYSGFYATRLKDLISALLPQHDVYVTDWENARHVLPQKGAFTQETNVDYILEFQRVIEADSMIGISQSTVPVSVAVAYMETMPRAVLPGSMILMAGAIDARINPTFIETALAERRLASYEGLEIQSVVRNGGTRRICLPEAFLGLRPDFKIAGQDRALMDLPAELVLGNIDAVFQRHLLPKGEWKHHGRVVTMAAIKKTALLTIEAGNDEMCGAGQTQAADGLCSNLDPKKKKHFTLPGARHEEAFSGPDFLAYVAPQLSGFIASYSSQKPGNRSVRSVQERVTALGRSHRVAAVSASL